MIMPDWEDEILDQLDAAAAEYNFPMLDNAYLRNAGIRLTVFRSPQEWLLVFEELAVSQPHGFVDVVSAYGNRVTEPGTQEAVTLAEEEEGQVWDENHTFLLDPSDFTVMLRSGEHRFQPSAEDYRRVGVEPGADMPDAVRVLRLLAATMPEELYRSDDELLAICGRGDAGLNRFLQLDGWHHPDLANDEMPSDNECFRSLARALSVGDSHLYVCPQDIWNTHWSNWEAAY
jgi:hypothetical protein